MPDFKAISTQVSRLSMLLIIPIFTALFFWNRSWALGLVWGYCFGMLAWQWRLRGARSILDRPNRVIGRQLLNLWGRFLLYGIALGGALYYNKINIWTTLAGMVLVNILTTYYLIKSK